MRYLNEAISLLTKEITNQMIQNGGGYRGNLSKVLTKLQKHREDLREDYETLSKETK